MRKLIMMNDKGFKADYSVEAGKSDGAKHFDHHGEYTGHIAPCRAEVPVAEDGSTIQISHIDADTYVGLLRLFGASLPEVDFALMEQVDLNGSSVCKDKFNPTLLYMVGIGEVARGLKFPRATEQEQDVTDIVGHMMAVSHDEVIEMGRKATEASEATYRECKVSSRGHIGFWKINSSQPFDPSRPYEDGTSVVVVYRENYRSVSVYCDPKSHHTAMTLGTVETFENPPQNYRATIGTYKMCGHPKATGTERTSDGWSYEDAEAIYNAIAG